MKRRARNSEFVHRQALDGLHDLEPMTAPHSGLGITTETFFLTHVDERAPAACRREEKGKSVWALRRIDPQTGHQRLGSLVLHSRRRGTAASQLSAEFHCTSAKLRWRCLPRLPPIGQGRLDRLLRQRAPMGRASRRRVDCTVIRQNRQEEPSERGSWRSWSRNRQARGLSGGGFVRASVVRVDRAALRAAQVNSAESGHQKSSQPRMQ